MGVADKSRETIDRITGAAIELFSEKGFDGARVDAIARRAGVNKAALYYHIGDKDALYRMVLRTVISDTLEQIESAVSSLAAPEEKLRTYVRIFARSAANNPGMAPIMMRELASGSKNLPAEIALIYGRTIDLVAEILEEGRQEGVFTAVAPLLVYVMIAGGVVLYQLSGPVRERLAVETGKRYDIEGTDDESIVRNIETIIMNAVLKRRTA